MEIIELSRPDSRYPAQLAKTKGAPERLWCVGAEPTLLGSTQLAVVGTREPSDLGKEAARLAAKSAAELSLTLTSGLALGVDEVAHRGALEFEAATIAVLASAPDTITPASNRDLAVEIVRRGGQIVSETPPGTGLERFRFVTRNRIISGLSRLVIVVESGASGGTMHTARFALEQGRPLLVLPGSEGCDLLLGGDAEALSAFSKQFSRSKGLDLSLVKAFDPDRAKGQIGNLLGSHKPSAE